MTLRARARHRGCEVFAELVTGGEEQKEEPSSYDAKTAGIGKLLGIDSEEEFLDIVSYAWMHLLARFVCFLVVYAFTDLTTHGSFSCAQGNRAVHVMANRVLGNFVPFRDKGTIRREVQP